MWKSLVLVAAIAGLPTSAVAAESIAVQKRAYHVLDPVPAELMRDLAADRPGVTEGATTLDAGHIQFEYVGTAAVTGGQKYQPVIGVAAAVPLGKNLQLDSDVRVGFGSSNYDWGGRAQTGRVTVSTGFTYRY
jgi:hypothetical protein